MVPLFALNLDVLCPTVLWMPSDWSISITTSYQTQRVSFALLVERLLKICEFLSAELCNSVSGSFYCSVWVSVFLQTISYWLSHWLCPCELRICVYVYSFPIFMSSQSFCCDMHCCLWVRGEEIYQTACQPLGPLLCLFSCTTKTHCLGTLLNTNSPFVTCSN